MSESIAQATPDTLLSLGIDPSRFWVLGIVAEPLEPVARPALALESSWGRCECPDECPRDHGNE
jgi:hypothetical protein